MRTTHYIDKLLEVIRQGDSATYKLYIGETAILTYSTLLGVEDAPPTLHYTLRDRLGSVVSVVDDSNTVIEHRSYDPFGKPRQGSLVSSSPATLSDLIGGTPVTQRGFTDHEHLDDAQLIHMNGRVYDYNLGRFLSVDPFIQAPGNSQSLNPYSYIMNNPLAGTDPSGYLSCSAEQTVGECGLEAGGTADIVDSDGNSLGTATLSEDGETLTTSGNNGVNATITGKVSNGVVFTLELQNKQDIGSQSHAAQGAVKLNLYSGSEAGDGTGEPDPETISDDVSMRQDLTPKSNKLQLKNGELTITINVYNSEFSGLDDEYLDKALLDISSAYSGHIAGNKYLKLKLVRISEIHNADLVIDICGYLCRKSLNGQQLPEKARAFVVGVGRGDQIYLTHNYISGVKTLEHEIGHYLGLHHQPNKSNSVMSYSNERAVSHSDKERIYDAYKSLF
ncbi:RHS repeat-associated core domain-containing protein [Pseudidiomarina taiwanensis]|uniref:RHS repeat-associated core domain-containing protein n=1 Tax=Pseudidiomarina taiwanensis TaxID=337250 RepID=UPI001F53EC30|nr:RHS repeat-associated core domain-containing protein [Pseudidiomarina taiwanensis]